MFNGNSLGMVWYFWHSRVQPHLVNLKTSFWKIAFCRAQHKPMQRADALNEIDYGTDWDCDCIGRKDEFLSPQIATMTSADRACHSLVSRGHTNSFQLVIKSSMRIFTGMARNIGISSEIWTRIADQLLQSGHLTVLDTIRWSKPVYCSVFSNDL